jgi:putative CocE/NonD family hydrolase
MSTDGSPPPDMIAAAVAVGTHDYSRHCWYNGALNLGILGWSDTIAHQEKPGKIKHLLEMRNRQKLLTGAIPLYESAEMRLGNQLPWLLYRLKHPDVAHDKYYEPMQCYAALEKADIPILLIGGWYDFWIDRTVEQYTRLRERGCTVALNIGPWAHMMSGFNSVKPSFEWVEQHAVGQAKKNQDSEYVKICVTGPGRREDWRHLSTWPPPTIPCVLYLQAGELSGDKPETESSSSFNFDPHDPTPSVGGATLMGQGWVDDSSLSKRHDVLTFTSSPLEMDVELMGKTTVQLAHSSDNPHVDLFLRLSEVTSGNKSTNIADAYHSLDPNRDDALVNISLNERAHRFAKGTRIRLTVAGGCHPRYARNLGTGENPATGSEMRPSTHTITYDASGISRIIMPISPTH